MRRKVWFVGLLTALLAIGICCAAAGEAQTLDIPTSVKRIGDEAFYGDDGILTVTVPNSVAEIGERAFAKCTGLVDVYFSANAVSIAADAFSGSDKVCLHVYAASAAHTYAKQYKIPYKLEGVGGTAFYTQTAGLLSAQDLSSTQLQSNTFGTMRLLVRTNGTALPDLSAYSIQETIVGPDNVYVLQFDTVANTTNCYNYLTNWSGMKFVEADECFSTGMDKVSPASMGPAWKDKDPMRCEAYAKFLRENGGVATVAVVDSGVGHHPSINSRVRDDGINLVDQNGSRYDGAQHGTCVAGIIVDCTPNLNVKILPVRVTNDKGYGTVMSIGNGIGYAIEKGVAVINLSMNCQESAYVKMMLDKAAEKGIKVVVAAGNASADCSATFPANRATCVTVSSIGASMAKTGESNYGATVDFCAPGDNVTCYLPGGGSILRHGTSFAAPHISAILAMIALDNRSISLKDYCTDLGSVGRDPNYGWGLPDLTKLATHAVTEIQITTPINKMICASSAYLNFSVLPESATDRTVEAISDKSGVLRVIETAGGYVAVESVGPGVAELTIRARDGSGVTAKRKITVVQKVSSITISGGNTELHVGKSLQLSAEVLPTDATERGITWSTSNGTVATVSNDGLVTGIADGAVTITATAKDGYKACGTCALTVKTIPDPTQVEIICGQDKLTVNQIIQLKAKVLPEDAPQAVTWRIGTGADIATISETGLLTVTGSGTISVEARSATKDGVFNYRVFTAIQLPESISIAGNHNIRVGGTTTLAATVLPATASDKSITWSSSNAGIATVSEGGIVTGVAKGDVTIWATSKVDTKIQQGFSIKVAPKTFEVVFNATGGNCGTSNMTATCGQPLGTLPVPTRDYYTFGGWYTAASGGTEVNASSGFERADTLQLYAHWTEKKQSDWVLSSEAPRDSKIVDTKWRYTENTASTSASMSGWVLSGSDWKQVSSGSFKYTSFPEGFDKSNWFYRTYHRPAYGTYENASEKRVASTSWTSYVYWHWMHDCGGSGAADRTILYYEGWGTNALTGPGDNFYYKNFGSFESTNTYSGGDVNWGQDDTLYAWYWGTGRSSYEESQGTYYWYRTPIYKCDYIDSVRWYQYTRECESASEPTASSTISGIVKYVKYQEK